MLSKNMEAIKAGLNAHCIMMWPWAFWGQSVEYGGLNDKCPSPTIPLVFEHFVPGCWCSLERLWNLYKVVTRGNMSLWVVLKSLYPCSISFTPCQLSLCLCCGGNDLSTSCCGCHASHHYRLSLLDLQIQIKSFFLELFLVMRTNLAAL